MDEDYYLSLDSDVEVGHDSSDNEDDCESGDNGYEEEADTIDLIPNREAYHHESASEDHDGDDDDRKHELSHVETSGNIPQGSLSQLYQEIEQKKEERKSKEEQEERTVEFLRRSFPSSRPFPLLTSFPLSTSSLMATERSTKEGGPDSRGQSKEETIRDAEKEGKQLETGNEGEGQNNEDMDLGEEDKHDEEHDEEHDMRKNMHQEDPLYDPRADDSDEEWMNRRRGCNCLSSTDNTNKSKNNNRDVKNESNRSTDIKTTIRTTPSSSTWRSDAVLNCPACASLLCTDCQRHQVYQTQYRAMFVFNCVVDSQEILQFDQQKTDPSFTSQIRMSHKSESKERKQAMRQRRKEASSTRGQEIQGEKESREVMLSSKSNNPWNDTADDYDDLGEREGETVLESISQEVTGEKAKVTEGVTRRTAEGKVWNQQETAFPAKSPEEGTTSGTVTTTSVISSKEEGDKDCIMTRTMTGEREGSREKNWSSSRNNISRTRGDNERNNTDRKTSSYFSVRCSVCSTQVAVYDDEQVYHFFNVLASHC